jgi:NADPH-dependent ferric siderophore reductase
VVDMNSDDTEARLRRIRREPPPFRRVQVRRTEPLSPRMVRIVFGGEDLDGFAIEGPASSVRLLVPLDGHDTIVMPSWTGNQFELPDGRRAPIRTFTPRYFDDDRLELTLDIVVHHDGVAANWARGALLGDEVAISGPGRTEALDPDAGSHLLAGDESAIPAIGQLLEALPHERSVVVHVEIGSPEARLGLPEHPGATVTWHEAVPSAVPGNALVRAVVDMDHLPDAVWVAGEAAAVQRLRKHLFDERGRSRSSVTARGYWKKGRSAT